MKIVPLPVDPEKLHLRARRRAIATLIEARFSRRALQEIRQGNTRYWDSPRNDLARGIRAEAMRERQRLSSASDDQLMAEIGYARISAPTSLST